MNLRRKEEEFRNQKEVMSTVLIFLNIRYSAVTFLLNFIYENVTAWSIDSHIGYGHLVCFGF